MSKSKKSPPGKGKTSPLPAPSQTGPLPKPAKPPEEKEIAPPKPSDKSLLLRLLEKIKTL